MFLSHMGSVSPVTIVPSTCPPDCDPDSLKLKKLRKSVEEDVRASLGNSAESSGRSSNRSNQQNRSPAQASNDSSSSNDRDGADSVRGSGVPGRNGGGRGRGGGRGGGRSGRGGGRGANAGRGARTPSNQLGCLFARDGVTELIPANLSVQLCADWLYVGKSCSHGYGRCPNMHYRFDSIPQAEDRKILADHVANTDGLWFNKNSVRSLTEAAHKLKLGDSNGPGTN